MVHTYQLSNGLKVIVEPMEYMRSVSVGVYIRCGSAFETIENNGISHMIEHMLFKGTKTASASDLAAKMNALGDDLNAYTAKEMTCFYGKVLDDDFENNIALLSDMILNSVFSEKEMEKEKQVIIEENQMYIDSAEDVVQEGVQHLAWMKHPLGYVISGSNENVLSFSREDVLAWKNRFYTANNMIISIAGHIGVSESKEILERYFNVIESGEQLKPFAAPEFENGDQFFEKDIEQSHLCLGFPGKYLSPKESYLFAIANNYFGGTSNSRLFQKVREELGYVYTIYSYDVTFSNTGIFQIYAAMNEKNVKKVYDLILSMLADFRITGMKESDMLEIKRQIRIEHLLSMESTMAHMEYNARCLLHDHPYMSSKERMELLDRITIDELNAFIKEYFDNDSFVYALSGNKNMLQKNVVEMEK